jgi:hypothetical protein
MLHAFKKNDVIYKGEFMLLLPHALEFPKYLWYQPPSLLLPKQNFVVVDFLKILIIVQSLIIFSYLISLKSLLSHLSFVAQA